MSLTGGIEEYDTANDWDDESPDDSSSEEEFDSSGTVDDVGGVIQLGTLSESNRLVVLSGPRAGTLADADDDSESNPRISLRSRDEALAKGVPILIGHRPHQKVDTVVRLLASVVAATSGRVSAAASVGLPQGTDESLKTWLDSCSVASIRLADPYAYLKDPTVVRVKDISAQALRWRPYLGATVIVVPDLLASQRAVGANLLLTSGRALDYTTPQASLDTAFAEGDDSLSALLATERLALNLTLPAAWLANATLRSKLFAQLVDEEQFDVWHIRVQWPASLRSLHQPLDAELLKGYKRLAQLAADEDRVLLLPQTGLTGWLQSAFGAQGFGTGLFGSAQAFKEHSTGGGGGANEIERYFEPSLLHPVERAVHDVMRAEAGYVQCDCPFCPALHSRSDWDHTLARLHFAHWQGRLAGLSAATGKTQESSVRRAVSAAIRASNAQPLAGISVPRHLPVWDQLL